MREGVWLDGCDEEVFSPVGGVKLRRLDSLYVHVKAELLRSGH